MQIEGNGIRVVWLFDDTAVGLQLEDMELLKKDQLREAHGLLGGGDKVPPVIYYVWQELM